MLVLLIQTPHWSVLTASTFLTCYSLLKLVQVVYLLKLLLEDLSDSYLCPDAVVSSPTSCCFDFSAALGADEHSSWKTFFFPCYPWCHSLLVFLRPQRSLLISFAGSSSSSARPLNMPRGWALAFFFSMTFLEAVSPIPEALNSVHMRTLSDLCFQLWQLWAADSYLAPTPHLLMTVEFAYLIASQS